MSDMEFVQAKSVAERGAAWTRATKGHALLRDVLGAVKDELASLRVLIRDEALPGIENALTSEVGALTEAVEKNTAMLDRVETAIMELPDWGVKRVHVRGCGMVKVRPQEETAEGEDSGKEE